MAFAESLSAEKYSYYYNTQELVWGITGTRPSR